jgi:hypothetical protein
LEGLLQRVFLAFSTLSEGDPGKFFDHLGMERDPKISLSKKEQQIIPMVKTRIEKFADDVNAVAGLPEDQKNAQTLALFQSMIKELIPGIPPGTSPIDWLISHLEWSRDPLPVQIFTGTHYSEYLDALEELAYQINQSSNMPLVEEFMRDATNHPDFKAMAQKLIQLPSYIAMFQPKQSNSIDLALMKRCVSNYQDLVAYIFEKQVRLILGVYCTLKSGVKCNYQDLKKRDLGSIMKEIDSLPEIAVLCKGVDLGLRNVLAHGTVTFAPSKREVELIPRQGPSKTFSFDDLFIATREVAAVVMALLNWRQMLGAESARRLRQVLGHQ